MAARRKTGGRRAPAEHPRLVWKGHDGQDRAPPAVPVVPIHVQERIHPQALIDDLRRRAAGAEPRAGSARRVDERIACHRHEDAWNNRLILGDSLLVMTSLARKEGLEGKVQMIYMDPPYGIEFGSRRHVSTRAREAKEGEAARRARRPEQLEAYRDTWALGVHSYLAYMRDRLAAARALLAESGTMFVQIGDRNVHLIRSVLDEIFGSENFVVMIAFEKTGAQTSRFLPSVADYILVYARSVEAVKYRRLYLPKEAGVGAGTGERYDQVDEDGRHYQLTSLTSPRPPGSFEVRFQGKPFLPSGGYWKTSQAGFQRLIEAGRVERAGRTLRYKRYLDDFPAYPLTNVWSDCAGSGSKVYVVQTSPLVVARCVLMATDPGDLVLDPTCGGGTTAVVAEQLGRRWITIGCRSHFAIEFPTLA